METCRLESAEYPTINFREQPAAATLQEKGVKERYNFVVL